MANWEVAAALFASVAAVTVAAGPIAFSFAVAFAAIDTDSSLLHTKAVVRFSRAVAGLEIAASEFRAEAD